MKSDYNLIRGAILKLEDGGLQESQLISRLKGSVLLEEMAALVGTLSGIIPLPKLHLQIARNFRTQSWQP